MTERKKIQCQYCGRELAPNVYEHHGAKCMHGPTGERVREFVRANLVDGAIMSKAAYGQDPRRRALGLPDEKAMYRHLGLSWRDFAAWCDVPYQVATKGWRKTHNSNPDRGYDDRIAEHRRKVAEAEAYYNQQQLIDRGVQRRYDPLRARYYTARFWEWR